MTAHATQFTFTQIDVGSGLSLFIEGNSKITASGGTFDRPLPNAFSLPAVSTCPGSTSACRAACYVGASLRRLAPDVYDRYFENERTLHHILTDRQAYGRAYSALSTWIALHCGEFRIHVSGDFFSEPYAQFWLDVCLNAPDVRFWTYTRSAFAVESLVGAPNLTVNLSCDKDNLTVMRALHSRLPNVTRLCYMADDADPKRLPVLPNGSVIFADYPQRGRDLAKPTDHPWWQGLDKRERKMVCVADFWGQSSSYRCGICTRCMVPPHRTVEST